MTSPSQHSIRNQLLALLPSKDMATLQPYLRRQSMEQGHVMEAPNEAISHVYFPEPGVVSIVAHAPTGMRLEAGIVGPEGMTGLALLNGADRSPNETFVQIPCRAWCIEAEVLRRVLREHRGIQDHFLLYAQAFAVQMAQSVLANGRCTIGERLARSILMCHDRADREDLPLTHEFLSLMLGVRRAGVTTSLQSLEGSEAILMRRGVVVVRDRAVLLEAAGDSYGVPETEYERLLGSP